MKPPISKNEIETKKEIKKAHIWIIISGLFMLLSFFLALSIYKIIRDTTDGDDRGLKEIKSLSIDLSSKQKGADEAGNEQDSDNLVRRNLDGVFAAEGAENDYAIAVMIDNSIFARPPSSLAKAGLVYEAEVEGGATRLMAVYSSSTEMAEIGPVRSARPYFVEWSREFAAPYVHCGGSPESLVKLAKEAVTDINEFYQGKYFWRDKTRVPPHNVYTSSQLLEKYLESKSVGAAEFYSWLFKDDMEEKDRPEANRIKINYRLPDYVVTWSYDRLSNAYIRYVGGRAHIDRNGDGIIAKDVVIQYLDARVIDEVLRLKMEVVGEGKAVVCLDGRCTDAMWRKNSAEERTRFYYENEEEVSFNAGPIWIEVVRPGYEVVIE